MKAICIDHNDLVFRDVPRPILGLEDIRIRVRTIGVNRADLMQRKGVYPAPKGIRQDILGLECAGEIIEIGAGVSSLGSAYLSLGSSVMTLVAGEAYAEEVVVHFRHVLPIPMNMSFREAAAFPEAFVTAFDALWLQAGVCPTDSVLIHAIGSGVGDAARQLCLAMGLSCCGTTRSPVKQTAIHTVQCPVYLIENAVFPSELPKVDVILDFVGASYFEANLRQLKEYGRLQIVGLLGGVQASIHLGVLLQRKLQIRGSTLRDRSIAEKTVLFERFSARIMPLLEAGQIRPTIASVYNWEEVELAHQEMADNRNLGKIVLQTS